MRNTTSSVDHHNFKTFGNILKYTVTRAVRRKVPGYPKGFLCVSFFKINNTGNSFKFVIFASAPDARSECILYLKKIIYAFLNKEKVRLSFLLPISKFC